MKESIDILSERKDENAEFFNEALNEIQEYEQCLSLCRMHPNSLPVSDSAYVAYNLDSRKRDEVKLSTA